MEIQSDRYIAEDEIKEMKSFKKDILEIMPKIKNKLQDDSDFVNVNEKSFSEIFVDFYKKERGTEPEKEVLDLLLSIMNEEEMEDEANKA